MSKWVWTAYCAMPDDPRGQYSEEIDVVATTPGKAREMAEELLKLEYDPGLKVRKVVRRAPVIEGASIFF
jgi:hypothetical protein